MTVTDQLKIIANKIKANQAQYDLDRLAAKISENIRKYEYLNGEDLGYKPSVAEQAKFDYSPLRKVFNKGLAEKDKKEGLLKSVKNIGNKNEELQKVFSTANKVRKDAKNESNFNNDSKYAFYRFYKDSENFKRMVSIDSNDSELKEFYELLSNFKNYKSVTIKTKKT